MGIRRTGWIVCGVLLLSWASRSALAQDGDRDDGVGLDLKRFGELRLEDGNGGAEPVAAPATEPKVEDLKSPLLRKLVDKGLLNIGEASEIDKEEQTK